PPSQSLRYVAWIKSSTKNLEGAPHRETVRIMIRRIGLPTRETNSSQAASSRGPAQRQTTSLRDNDEYRVDLELFDIQDRGSGRQNRHDSDRSPCTTSNRNAPGIFGLDDRG